jgi:hypothetical protein
MAQQCSVCSRGEDVARTVNELLEKKTPIKLIEQKTGVSHSTLSRHKLGNCEFSFSNFKAARVKSRNAAPSGFIFIQWPGGKPGLHSCPKDFKGAQPDVPGPSDVVLQISFEPAVAPRPPRVIPAEILPKEITEP